MQSDGFLPVRKMLGRKGGGRLRFGYTRPLFFRFGRGGAKRLQKAQVGGNRIFPKPPLDRPCTSGAISVDQRRA